MGKFVKGEVVTLPFPFSNLGGTKRRPALVISDFVGDDVILCQITASRNDAYSVELRQSDFTTGSLPQDPSYIRPNKIFTAQGTVILKKDGAVNQAKYREVVDKIMSIIS
jgi:mRNA interferase MazF